MNFTRLLLAWLGAMVLSGCGVSAPTIESFTAERSTITKGQAAKLIATFANGTARIEGIDAAVSSGVSIESGPLSADTTFTLTVTNSAGESATASVEVKVVAAPAITRFAAAVPLVTSGEGTTLAAEFSGGVGVVSPGIGAVQSGAAVRTGALTASTTFTLTVTNAAGDVATAAAQVDVAQEPTIISFAATKATITAGQAAHLTAVFAGGSGSVDQGVGMVTNGAAVTTPALSQTTTFTLTVSGPVGAPKTASVTVTVVPAPVITSFSVVDAALSAGATATLQAVFSGGGGTVSGVGAISSGVDLPTPALSQDTTFTLSVVNPAGDAVTAQVSVAVYPLPTITSFSAAKSPITVNQAPSLTAVFANGTGVVDQGVGAVQSAVAVNAATLVSPGNTTYHLTVTNPAGDSTSAQVSVSAVAAPAIGTFAAGPTHVTLGTSTVLSGSFTGGTASIDQGVGNVNGPSFSVSSTPVATSPTAFTLTVTNAAGDSVTRVANITAVAAPVITSFVVAAVPDGGFGSSVTVPVGAWAQMVPTFQNGVGMLTGPSLTTIANSGQTFSFNPTGDVAYQLSVGNDAGTTVNATVNINIDHDIYTASSQGYVAVYRTHPETAAAPSRKIFVQNCPEPTSVAYQPASPPFVPPFLWVGCKQSGALAARLMKVQSPAAINNTVSTPSGSAITPISGALTGLTAPASMVFDGATLFVIEQPSLTVKSKILAFAPNAGGNVAPVRSLEAPTSGDLTTLGALRQIAYYQNQLYVTSRNLPSAGGGANGVLVFSNTWSGTNVAPVRSLAPAAFFNQQLNGVAASADGLFVSSPTNLFKFTVTANANQAPANTVSATGNGQLAIFDRSVLSTGLNQLTAAALQDAAVQRTVLGAALEMGTAGGLVVDPTH